MSLNPNLPDEIISHRRRRSADARLCNDAVSLKTPKGKTPATLGLSPKTPAFTSDDAENGRTTTPRRSERILSRNRAASEYRESAPRTPEHLMSVDARDSSADPCSPRSGYINTAEEILTPSRARQLHSTLCGKTYVYLARLRSHEKECKECVSLQPPERKSETQLHEETIDIRDDVPKLRADRESCSPSTKIKGKQKAKDANNCVQLVDAALIDAINEKLSENEKEGYIYIFSTLEKEGLVKIGRSVHPHKRMKQHKKCTSDLNIIRISGRVKAMKRAEHLIKIDLGHRRSKWDCLSCNQVHEEWFKVTETEVKIVVDRWINWINDHGPYSNNKNLDPLWSYLLGYVRLLPTDMDGDNHAARWSHWDRVLAAPLADDIARFDKYGRQRTTEEGSKPIAAQEKEGIKAMELPFRQLVLSDEGSLVRARDVVEQIGQTVMVGGGNWSGNLNMNFINYYGSGVKGPMERVVQG